VTISFVVLCVIFLGNMRSDCLPRESSCSSRGPCTAPPPTVLAGSFRKISMRLHGRVPQDVASPTATHDMTNLVCTIYHLIS
jgi:hypothetical protein